MSADPRSAVLERIGRAMRRHEPPSGRDAAWAALPRAYGHAVAMEHDALLRLLEERLRDYDAEVTRVAEARVGEALDRLLEERRYQPALLARGFPSKWAPRNPDVAVEPAEALSPRELDRFQTVVTGATLAIAETGTLVLQSVAGQGRRASTLVPDVHVCVVRAADVVPGVPEAFERLAGTATLPTTLISGPSATADIEMTRIKGVHGPRFLHVLLVQ